MMLTLEIMHISACQGLLWHYKKFTLLVMGHTTQP